MGKIRSPSHCNFNLILHHIWFDYPASHREICAHLLFLFRHKTSSPCLSNIFWSLILGHTRCVLRSNCLCLFLCWRLMYFLAVGAIGERTGKLELFSHLIVKPWYHFVHTIKSFILPGRTPAPSSEVSTETMGDGSALDRQCLTQIPLLLIGGQTCGANRCNRSVISADIPSGMGADSEHQKSRC